MFIKELTEIHKSKTESVISDKKIFVTKPSLPDLDEFIPYLKTIWESRILTNEGDFHKMLEYELANFLGVKYLSLFSNGTLALISALQVLRISGEVITTPYSFVATTHALHWNGIKPVFSDIDPVTKNLDPNQIEKHITPKTSAILPVHVYGNPCDVNSIEDIADTYGLKVIYDAAHAFGVRRNGESILNFGDLSVLSFHATKVFNTFEGGAIICHDEKTKKRIDYLKNFGFADETVVIAPGINAKMNEMQAALGLLQLKNFDNYVMKRKVLTEFYRKELSPINGIDLLKISDDIDYNYAYFPIFINENEFGMSRDEFYDKLKQFDVYTRRYFFPLISQFPTYRGLDSSVSGNLPVAEKTSREVLCLPIYPDLAENDLNKIINAIWEIHRSI